MRFRAKIKIVTVSQLSQQRWIENNDELDHINAKAPRVLKLRAQCENHPYAEKFIKKHNFAFTYGTYVLEGDVDANFK